MADQRQVNMVNIPAVPLRLERDLHDFLSAIKAGIRLRNGGFKNALDAQFITQYRYNEALAKIDELEARVEALENA